ncbi:MAG TPA: cyclopropane fatty acyl phospholipid synthase [Terriglobales bacterium]|nr:cyclopropane fatty acyl phospholipid synthase [Terriglobales bacterium]
MSAGLVARAREIFASAGITLNGGEAWDITVHHPEFYARVLGQGSLGLGESYMDGWWDSPRLDQFFQRAFDAGLDRDAGRGWRAWLLQAGSALCNRQTRRRSVQVARRHYDVGNELYQAMLDRRMVYTAGRWEQAANLNQAQEAKLDFVCQKLELAPDMRVLDIGCGWGSFAKFAAERYGARVDGITLSQEQLALGQSLCAGLPVQLWLEDYREVEGRYDRLVSLGMFEHVGYKNYRAYFEIARRHLAAGGRMFLSTIGSNRSVRSTDPWIERYIFPNSHLPSIQQVGDALEDRFIPLEWLNWAGDYDRTLMAWFGNFEAQWERWQRQYSERFCRMWKFYLLSSAAAFRARQLQDWQMVLAPLGV